MRRVVITGAGTINAIGGSVPETFAAMKAGTCGIGPLEMRDLDRLSVGIGAQVKDYDEAARFDKPQLALYDRFTQFALIAGREAMTQAGLQGLEADRLGVVLGNCGGGLNTQDDSYRAFYEAGKSRVHPFTVPRLMGSAATAHLSIAHGATGPSFTVSTACASSNHAMGQALALIRAGLADAMLTGGSEAMLCPGGVKAWEGLRVMSREACRPFSATRSGMVQGEGAAIFVFEALEHAEARRAKILAEVAGIGMSSDAGDIVLPSREGASRAMALALRDARLEPSDVSYINAHGTATKANDRVETAAIRDTFGAHADALAVTSTKAMHGHVIGGAGAVELLACLMALNESVIAPTIGFEAADPDCDLDVVPNQARTTKVEATLSNAFAFGGQNAVIALTKAP